MSSVRYPDKDPCYLLWELREGKMYLLSICSEEWLAKMHMKATIEMYEMFNQTNRVDFRLHIETSQLNHLYGRRER